MYNERRRDAVGVRERLNRCDFSAHIGNLALDTRTHFSESQPKLAMTTPLDCGFFNGKRISFLRIDPALERGAKRNSYWTGDAAAPGRKVSELALATDDLALRRKLTRELDGHATMTAFLFSNVHPRT